MGETLKTTTGVEIRDIVRFFYGDGPAAQFEAGQDPIVALAVVLIVADIAYCYRAPKRSLQERQEFVLQGRAWRRGGMQAHYNIIPTCAPVYVHGNTCV